MFNLIILIPQDLNITLVLEYNINKMLFNYSVSKVFSQHGVNRSYLDIYLHFALSQGSHAPRRYFFKRLFRGPPTLIGNVLDLK